MQINDLVEILKLSNLDSYIEKLKESFIHADKDKDNYINKDEFFELLNFYINNKTKDERINSSFLMLDKDGDSKITLNDLREYVEQMEYSSITDEELMEMLNINDDG